MALRASSLRTCGAFLVWAFLTGPASGQAPPLLHLDDVKKLPGVRVARAQTRPETPLQLTAYRVEKVSLPQAYAAWVEGRKTDVTTGFLVTVSFASPLTVRDQAFSLVIDGRWCGFLQEGPDLRSADTVCFDPTLIREGAALGVTYRAVQIQSTPADEKELGPDVSFTDASDAVHYSSVRLRLSGPR